MQTHSFEIVNPSLEEGVELQPTVIIFPGIHENMFEVKKLAEDLWRNNGNTRIISICRLNQDSEVASLEKKSLSIAEEILNKKRPYPAYPIWLIGYSFGCTMAQEVAVKLKEQGQFDPHLILIDGVSPPVAQHYFQSKHAQVTRDLIVLFNHAARAHLPHTEIALPNESLLPNELIYLTHLPVTEQIDTVIKLIAERFSVSGNEKQVKGFLDSAKRVKENLDALIHHDINTSIQKLGKMTVLMTNETQEKYANVFEIDPVTMKHGGWENYAEEIIDWTQYITTGNQPKLNQYFQNIVDELIDTSHIDLMTENASYKLAMLLDVTINNEVPKSEVKIKKDAQETFYSKIKTRLEDLAAQPESEYVRGNPDAMETSQASPQSDSSGLNSPPGTPSEKGDNMMSIDSSAFNSRKSSKLLENSFAHLMFPKDSRSTTSQRKKILRSPDSDSPKLDRFVRT